MISKMEQTILYLMAESIAYERNNIDERIKWGNELLKKIDGCSNRNEVFK